eukprot:2606435-Rhodomonas_salina.1
MCLFIFKRHKEVVGEFAALCPLALGYPAHAICARSVPRVCLCQTALSDFVDQYQTWLAGA